MNRKRKILRKFALAALLCWVLPVVAAFAQSGCCDASPGNCSPIAHGGHAGVPDGFPSDTCTCLSPQGPMEGTHSMSHPWAHKSQPEKFCTFQSCCRNVTVAEPAVVGVGSLLPAAAENDAGGRIPLLASVPIAEPHFSPFYSGPLYLQKHSLII